MLNNYIQGNNDNIVSKIINIDPLHQINEKEFNEVLLTFGSFVSIIYNKRINQTTLLNLIIENKEYRQCFKILSGIDDTRMLIYNLISRFPILSKSKIVKTKIKDLTNDGKRAIDI
jgi:hypothetical protein